VNIKGAVLNTLLVWAELGYAEPKPLGKQEAKHVARLVKMGYIEPCAPPDAYRITWSGSIASCAARMTKRQRNALGQLYLTTYRESGLRAQYIKGAGPATLRHLADRGLIRIEFSLERDRYYITPLGIEYMDARLRLEGER
jgi:hypothetical protein